MTRNPFQEFIESLTEDNLANLISGSQCINVDDNNYLLSPDGVNLTQYANKKNVRQMLIDKQFLIKQALYKENPLCRKEFDYQAHLLIMKTQPESFCHHASKLNEQALIIDGSVLITVKPSDARHKYGYCSQQDKNLTDDEAREAVFRWIKSGEAYSDYRVKTHCLYICG